MSLDQQAALEIHRQARAELSIGPLTWDRNLAHDAQQYANHLASVDRGLQHSQHAQQQGQGENLAGLSGNWVNPYTEASQLWYAEKKDWNRGILRGQDYQAVGHYTQMIWSTTTHIGMGNAISATGTTYVVARYSPSGNYIGESPLGNGRPQSPAYGNIHHPYHHSLHERRPPQYRGINLPLHTHAQSQPGPLSHHPLSIPLHPLPPPGPPPYVSPNIPWSGMGPPPFFNPNMLPAHGNHFGSHPPPWRLKGSKKDNVVHTGLCTIL